MSVLIILLYISCLLRALFVFLAKDIQLNVYLFFINYFYIITTLNWLLNDYLIILIMTFKMTDTFNNKYIDDNTDHDS